MTPEVNTDFGSCKHNLYSPSINRIKTSFIITLLSIVCKYLIRFDSCLGYDRLTWVVKCYLNLVVTNHCSSQLCCYLLIYYANLCLDWLKYWLVLYLWIQCSSQVHPWSILHYFHLSRNITIELMLSLMLTRLSGRMKSFSFFLMMN